MEELDLRQLFSMFWNKKIHIIIIIAVFVVIGGIYTMFGVTPKYKSSTTIVLAKTSGEENTNTITTTDITLNQKLISTYSELIKSKAVTRQVLENLNMTDVSDSYLRKNITVSSVKDTELIQITVAHENKEYTAALANEIAKVFEGKVNEIYHINNVNVVDKAEMNDIPYNINHIKDIGIFVAIGLVVAVAYVLVYNMIDTTVKTAEDIEKQSGLMVLASVPKFDSNERLKGGNI